MFNIKKAFIKKILLVVDGHDRSIKAAKYAILLSHNLKTAELYGIAVVDTKTLRELMKSKIFIESESYEYAEELKKNAGRYLNFVEELAKKKDLEIKKVIKEGSIHGKVIETADEIDADLIIVAGWHHTVARRDMIDNEHKHIAEGAQTPVIVIPDNDKIDLEYKKL